jgi:hypothetical protein
VIRLGTTAAVELTGLRMLWNIKSRSYVLTALNLLPSIATPTSLNSSRLSPQQKRV